MNWIQLCERSVLWSLSSGLSSHWLDVTPGNDEKESDDSRDWSSDVASNLSMAVKTRQTPLSAWLENVKPRPFPATGREGEMTKLKLASQRCLDKLTKLTAV